MDAYIEPIRTAALLFPIVALIFTLPYMAVQYRKYGAILALRTVIVYSFILYLMCAYFMTILPLPTIEHVNSLTSSTVQLIPFYQTMEIFRNSHVNIAQPMSYWRLIWNRDFFQLIANVILLVPFGMYLRFYFERSFRQVVLFSLGLSLFFEITQLTGLFFIYPRPYRLADVDDLISNVAGGMLGWWLAPVVMKVLPSKERMDAVAYRRGKYVSFTRRMIAALLDALLMLLMLAIWRALDDRVEDILFSGGGMQSLRVAAFGYAVGIIFYFIIGEWLWKGATPGKRMLRMKLVDLRTGGAPRLWQCAVRYGILYFIIFPAPGYLLVMLLMALANPANRIWWGVGIAVLLWIYVLFWLLVLIHAFTRSIQLLHDKLSMTRNMSTILITPEISDEADKAGISLEVQKRTGTVKTKTGE